MLKSLGHWFDSGCPDPFFFFFSFLFLVGAGASRILHPEHVAAAGRLPDPWREKKKKFPRRDLNPGLVGENHIS